MKAFAYVSMIGFGLVSNAAFASFVCTPAFVPGSQDSPACVSFEIPDNGAISAKFSCNGYDFGIDVDLHSLPNELSLSIVGPDGTSTSSSGENELSLIDESGNGALIRCSAE